MSRAARLIVMSMKSSGDHEEAHGKSVIPMNEHSACEWVRRMKNSDGTTGEHFRPEMAEQMRAAYCPDCGKWEFYACLNMMHSDYQQEAKALGVDKPEFYAHMAKAFLCDADARPEKMARYVEYVAE